jgi:hypothetical protein
MPFPASPTSPSLHDLLREKFDALLDECDLVMDTAKHGRTFHDLDEFFCTKGHELLQEVFQQKLQEQIATTEKNTEARYKAKKSSRNARTHHRKTK